MLCNHNGISTTLPKNAAYPKQLASVPSAKLRDLNRLKSTMGCFSVNSQMSHAAKPTTVTMSSATMDVEWNQARSLPLSSMICKAPTHTNKSARPTRSNGIFRVGVSCDCKFFQHIQAQNTPTGTLMRKIHGQT